MKCWRLRGRSQPVETATAGREEGLRRKRCRGSAGNNHGHCLCPCNEVAFNLCQLLPLSPKHTLNKALDCANVFHRGL